MNCNSYRPGPEHRGAHPHKIWGEGGRVNSIVGQLGPTFQIPIYRYRHNRSQNNFALFAYSNPTDVGTDFLLFIGFSGPTFYTKLYIFGGGTSPPPPQHTHTPNVRPCRSMRSSYCRDVWVLGEFLDIRGMFKGFSVFLNRNCFEVRVIILE